MSTPPLVSKDRDSWTVTEAFGPQAAKCIESAIIHAGVTGSVGATFQIGGDETEESSATVKREVSK